jgi:SnoaL-like polyketide cyclase
MQTVENAIEDQVAEGDTVVTRWTTHGTNTGSLFGKPATNKPATITGITIDHIVGGKIVETWTNFDALGMLQQLGAVGQRRLRRMRAELVEQISQNDPSLELVTVPPLRWWRNRLEAGSVS